MEPRIFACSFRFLTILVYKLVQFGAVGVEVTGLGLVGGAADGGVQIFLIRAKLGDGQLLAVERDQCTAVDLLVLG